jgi:dipeptidyl-peptidase-3
LIASTISKVSESHTLPNGASLHVKYGDFSEYMAEIAKNIKAATPFAANENQKEMLKNYFDSFETGSINAHKESQRYWLRDVGPVVETNIGFIETYRDPQGVRAEWEGFVAMVNKSQTEKFENLVKDAPKFISRLPWPKEFERSVINNVPDFTSLEVLNFATAGLPAGINIPNYTDITQVMGSKNVSLGNVMTAHSPNQRFPFVRDEDYDIYFKYRLPAFEVQVGTHELGHGTGILFTEDGDGKRNFGDDILNPLTNEPIQHWYRTGQNFNSVFKNIASSYEECRAEAIAMVLIPHLDIQAIFGHDGNEAEDVIFTSYLNMARAGLTALELYDPRAKKVKYWYYFWRKTHGIYLYIFFLLLLVIVGTSS